MLRRFKLAAKVVYGRYLALRPGKLRFRGAFSSVDEAMAEVRSGMLAGYDHDSVSDVSRSVMEQVALWDYPILYWLTRLAPEIRRVVDAGGHTGVKHRAFGRFLDLARIDWIVYDLPAQVKAGRALARVEDRTLSFTERIEDIPAADLLLASGLMPYLDGSLVGLVRRMHAAPRYILFNKVVTRTGPTVVTLENFGVAEIPYQIRNDAEVPAALDALGYDIIDSWVIDSLGHDIPTHPGLGRSVYRGYAARRRESSGAP